MIFQFQLIEKTESNLIGHRSSLKQIKIQNSNNDEVILSDDSSSLVSIDDYECGLECGLEESLVINSVASDA